MTEEARQVKSPLAASAKQPADLTEQARETAIAAPDKFAQTYAELRSDVLSLQAEMNVLRKRLHRLARR